MLLTCDEMKSDLKNMRGKHGSEEQHKKEMPARINSDEMDRKNIRVGLKSCIDPLDYEQHPPDNIVNIYSGN